MALERVWGEDLLATTALTTPQVGRMPRLSEFYGIAIYMYFVDHNPPHFHAIYAEYEALICVDDGSIIRGELPKTAMRLVEQWRTLHYDELTGPTLRNLQRCQGSILSSNVLGMAIMPRVTDVEHHGDRALRVTFSDGLVRELDFGSRLPGILATTDDDLAFADATVDTVAGTVCWPNGIDLDPDVLHGDQTSASAVQPKLLREYRMQQTV